MSHGASGRVFARGERARVTPTAAVGIEPGVPDNG
jgi:hypothetical protein